MNQLELNLMRRKLDEVKKKLEIQLKEKSDFVKWLKGYSDDLSIMKNIYAMGEDKEQIYKIMGQMEMILEILDYIKSKNKENMS